VQQHTRTAQDDDESQNPRQPARRTRGAYDFNNSTAAGSALQASILNRPIGVNLSTLQPTANPADTQQSAIASRWDAKPSRKSARASTTEP